MKKIFILFIAIFTISVSGYSQSKEYKSTLTKLFDISGTQATYQTAIKQMMAMLKLQNSTVPENVWSELEQEFLKTSIDELVTLLAPVYEKHLSIEDLKQLIAFYESPVGKKYAQSTPLITKESMEVGQVWGAKIGKQVAEKLKKKGY